MLPRRRVGPARRALEGVRRPAPSREVDSLIEWSAEELDALQGSRLADRARERIALADSVYDEVFPRLNDADPTLWMSGKLGSAVAGGTGIDVTAAARKKGERARDKYTSKEAFRWAWATVLARAFSLPDVGEDGDMGLCPGLDLFNHGSEAEKCEVRGVLGASLELDEDDPQVGPRIVLRAGVGGAESGEQLFHDYADRASGGSLLEFGFTHRVRSCTKPIDGKNNIVERHHDDEGVFDGLDENWALAAKMTNDAGDEDEEDFEECSLTEESDHLRRALHALDVSLKPLMATCDQDTVAARLEALADAGLCGGLTWEVSNVDSKYPAGERRLKGIECVPDAMIRAARILSLTNEELERVRDANAESDDDKWTAREALSLEHERRSFDALASDLPRRTRPIRGAARRVPAHHRRQGRRHRRLHPAAGQRRRGVRARGAGDGVGQNASGGGRVRRRERPRRGRR